MVHSAYQAYREATKTGQVFGANPNETNSAREKALGNAWSALTALERKGWKPEPCTKAARPEEKARTPEPRTKPSSSSSTGTLMARRVTNDAPHEAAAAKTPTSATRTVIVPHEAAAAKTPTSATRTVIVPTRTVIAQRVTSSPLKRVRIVLPSPLPVAPPSLVTPCHHLLAASVKLDLFSEVVASPTPLSTVCEWTTLLDALSTHTKAESEDLAMGIVVDEALANLHELEVTGLALDEPPEGWERAAHLGVPPEGWELAACLDVLTTTESTLLDF